ncbi:MAG: GNAT family N-acetyltransferase [Paracoccaceae bacterium]
MNLRAATVEDFPLIREIAGRAENAACLTDEDEVALAAYLSDPAARLLIWGDPAPLGFALFCDVGLAGGVVNLLRLGLDQPGVGQGVAFLRALIDHAFAELLAERLWLDTTGENLRAQKVYARAGFTLEGRLRGHDFRPAVGRVLDTLLFGMLRAEWEALPD